MADKTPSFVAEYDFALTAPGRPPLRPYRDAGKRILDIVLCCMALPFVLVILAIVWVVGQFSGGKVFFAQDRIGRHGETFRCLKVRTMVCDAEEVLARMIESDPEIAAEWSKYQKLREDPRVTAWGHLLRRTSVDELPQIFNILRGEMSIVGPRPFMANQLDLYRAGGGSRYFSMRPGLTGEWQVIGRGESTFVERVRFDNLYYERMSLWHDLKLIAGTIRALFLRTGH